MKRFTVAMSALAAIAGLGFAFKVNGEVSHRSLTLYWYKPDSSQTITAKIETADAICPVTNPKVCVYGYLDRRSVNPSTPIYTVLTGEMNNDTVGIKHS